MWKHGVCYQALFRGARHSGSGYQPDQPLLQLTAEEEHQDAVCGHSLAMSLGRFSMCPGICQLCLSGKGAHRLREEVPVLQG